MRLTSDTGCTSKKERKLFNLNKINNLNNNQVAQHKPDSTNVFNLLKHITMNYVQSLEEQQLVKIRVYKNTH